MDQSVQLETFLQPGVDLITSYDAIGLNNGVLFFRNTDWTKNLLKTWASSSPSYEGHPSPEQSALAHLLYREPKDKWISAPQKAFNSYLYELYPNLSCPEGQYSSGDFILHLPGVSNDVRVEIFKRYSKERNRAPAPILPGRTALLRLTGGMGIVAWFVEQSDSFDKRSNPHSRRHSGH
jgi:hypothetical protein